MVKNIVVISDTHFGCQLAICPNTIKLDNGGLYKASRLQKKIYQMWEIFWNEFIPKATENEDFILVHNGDLIDGVHHNSVTQISQNITDQMKIAYEVMHPIVSNKKCKAYYQIRGTEAHTGKSGQYEEELAKNLGAKKSEDGLYSRYDLWLEFGKKKLLANFTHHIGTTNSAAYESTAPHKEIIEAYVEAGKWGLKPPDIVVRSHRHRFYQNILPSKNVNAITAITPAWQLKTPFVWKGGFGRTSTPQIGGIVIREGTEVPIYVKHKIWNIERSKKEIV